MSKQATNPSWKVWIHVVLSACSIPPRGQKHTVMQLTVKHHTDLYWWIWGGTSENSGPKTIPHITRFKQAQGQQECRWKELWAFHGRGYKRGESDAAASLTHPASLAMDGWRSRAKALSRLYLVPCMQKSHITDLQLQYVLLHLTVVICVFHWLKCGQRERAKEMIMCNVYTMFTFNIHSGGVRPACFSCQSRSIQPWPLPVSDPVSVTAVQHQALTGCKKQLRQAVLTSDVFSDTQLKAGSCVKSCTEDKAYCENASYSAQRHVIQINSTRLS